MRERGEYTKGTAMQDESVIDADRTIQITDQNGPYRQPRTETMGLTPHLEHVRRQIAGFEMGYLNNEPKTDKALLEPLLLGLSVKKPDAPYAEIARLEVIYHPDERAQLYRRGLGTFDNNGVPLFFARYVSLGDKGDRTEFTHWLFRQIGIPDEVFDEINSSVRDRYYTVVVSREAHRETGAGKVDTPLPDYRMRDTWDWWIVESETFRV